jgi:metal-responsive CopG/Arc/MetJ family transcriptional regulator
MRATRTLSISINPVQLRQVERLARRECRTMSELVREALRRYEDQQRLERVNDALLAALRAVQEDARRSGASRLSRRQVAAEISAVRRQNSGRAPAR